MDPIAAIKPSQSVFKQAIIWHSFCFLLLSMLGPVGLLTVSALDYPVPQTSLQHKITLSGTTTSIVVDANAATTLACRDNLGSANFQIAWANDSRSFYDSTGTNYIFNATCETELKSLNLPMSRIYNLAAAPGGLHHSLDMLADICNRTNLPQAKTIICLETWQATTAAQVLAPSVYADAVSYAKAQGYGFKYWEISNEPQYAWGCLDTPTVYAQHVKDCYDAIKNVDADMIVGCQICRKSWYTDQVLGNIAGKADFIAAHWYGMVNTDTYATTDVILIENYKDLDFTAYENQNIRTLTGKSIPQIDTEWRLLGDGTIGGVLQTGEWNDKCGNIVGTLFQAVRLIYSIRDNYTFGANCWHATGGQPGILVPAGYGTTSGSVDMNGKTSYLYWLYYYFIANTGTQVLKFSGACPSYTGKTVHNVDAGSGSDPDLVYTGPLTPLLVTRSTDGSKLYMTVVNASDATTVAFSAAISNFLVSSQSAVRIHDADILQPFYQNDTSRFLSTPGLTYAAGTLSCSLPPLSCTFITLAGTTLSGTPTQTPSVTLTRTISATATLTPSKTVSATCTATPSLTLTPQPGSLFTSTPTPTVSPTSAQISLRNEVLIYPNPAQTVVHFAFLLDSPGEVRLELFNVAARKVATLSKTCSSSGKVQLDWNCGQVAPGVYLGKLSVLTPDGFSKNYPFLKITLTRKTG
jgi:hypothetical protein